MPPFLQDAFDLACFRVKPLDHYAYDWWQPVLWLSLLGTLPVLSTVADGADHLPILLILSLTVTWVSALIMTFFFGWWLSKDAAWSGHGSLFPLVVLCSSSQLLGLILTVLPDTVASLLALVVVFYQLSVVLNALGKSTGVSNRHVVKGFFLYFVICLAIGMVLTAVALSAGWITLPPESGGTPALTAPEKA